MASGVVGILESSAVLRRLVEVATGSELCNEQRRRWWRWEVAEVNWVQVLYPEFTHRRTAWIAMLPCGY